MGSVGTSAPASGAQDSTLRFGILASGGRVGLREIFLLLLVHTRVRAHTHSLIPHVSVAPPPSSHRPSLTPLSPLCLAHPCYPTVRDMMIFHLCQERKRERKKGRKREEEEKKEGRKNKGGRKRRREGRKEEEEGREGEAHSPLRMTRSFSSFLSWDLGPCDYDGTSGNRGKMAAPVTLGFP